MKKLVYLLGVAAILTSCKDNNLSPTVGFVISNTSSKSIKEAIISTEGNGKKHDLTRVVNILPTSQKSIDSNLKDSKEVKEGHYKVSVSLDNGDQYQKEFGYFTNGVDPNKGKKYNIVVTDSNIDIK